jgi:hypothetical protein
MIFCINCYNCLIKSEAYQAQKPIIRRKNLMPSFVINKAKFPETRLRCRLGGWQKPFLEPKNAFFQILKVCPKYEEASPFLLQIEAFLSDIWSDLSKDDKRRAKKLLKNEYKKRWSKADALQEGIAIRGIFAIKTIKKVLEI